VLRRTLTILGGAAAGTAIAWAISAASASADPGCDAPALPALEQVAPVTDLVCTVDRVVPATDLGAAADNVAELTPQVPVGIDELGGTDSASYRVSSSASGHGPRESSPRPVATPTAPTLPSMSGIDPDVLVKHTATDRALGDGMTRRGSPAPVAPFTPVPLPAAPGGGTSGHSGGADSPAFGALAGSAGRPGTTAPRALPAAELLPVDEPGTQPGVTPD
jgi:hypothetical protein